MEREQLIIDLLGRQGILPLFYHDDQQVCIDITRALYQEGVRMIEFTNRGTHAKRNFSSLVQLRNEELKDLVLAVGTIKTAEDANYYIESGADVLISPMYDADVQEAAYLQKILWIPGCMTPTEIHHAEKSGCRIVKLFPGNVLQPGFVSAVKELFPSMKFMPTGGVEIEDSSIRQWFDAGVFAVGMGSKLISKKDLDEGNIENVRERTSQALSIIRKITTK